LLIRHPRLIWLRILAYRQRMLAESVIPLREFKLRGQVGATD